MLCLPAWGPKQDHIKQVGLNHSLFQGTDITPPWSPEEKLDFASPLSSKRSQFRARNVAFYYLYFKCLPQGLTLLEYALPISWRQITIQMFALAPFSTIALQVHFSLQPRLFIYLLIKSSRRSYTNNKCQKVINVYIVCPPLPRDLLDNGIHIWHQ